MPVVVDEKENGEFEENGLIRVFRGDSYIFETNHPPCFMFIQYSL